MCEPRARPRYVSRHDASVGGPDNPSSDPGKGHDGETRMPESTHLLLGAVLARGASRQIPGNPFEFLPAIQTPLTALKSQVTFDGPPTTAPSRRACLVSQASGTGSARVIDQELLHRPRKQRFAQQKALY